MIDLYSQLETRSGAGESAITEMLRELATPLPADYLDFLRRSNGAIGKGPDIFLNLEPAEAIPETTTGYEAPQYCPGLVIIGGDGCGNIIGIDTRSGDPATMEYVVLDPIWLDIDSESCQYRSTSLCDVLKYLADR